MDMKISSVMRAYDVTSVQRNVSTQRVSRAEEKTDMVALSSQARDYQSIAKAVANTSDIREDKVKSIKNQINSGSYQVSPDELAKKMLKGIGF